MTVKRQRKTLTTAAIPLVGLLLVGGISIADGSLERITVTEGGIKFLVDHYDNRVSKPYRVMFRKDGVKSKYSFNAGGYVTGITAGSEKYSVRRPGKSEFRTAVFYGADSVVRVISHLIPRRCVFVSLSPA